MAGTRKRSAAGKPSGKSEAPAESTSRVRVERTTAERVQVIVDLMAALKWHPREAKRLAARWGISPSRVQNLSAEASRVVKAAVGDTEQVRARFVAALEQIATDARQARRVIIDAKGKRHAVLAPDYHAATRALGTAADLMGLKTSAIEVTGKKGGPIEIDHSAEAHILGKLAELAAAQGAADVSGEPEREGADAASVELGVLGPAEPASA